MIKLGKETTVSLITKFKTNNEEIILKFKFHYIIATFRNSGFILRQLDQI